VTRSRLLFAGIAATLAAVLASAGDFILLAHGAMRIAGDRTADAPVLIAGHFLGTLCIPFYAGGYWLVGAGLANAGRWARAVFPLGCYVAAVGAVVHGVTAMMIETNRDAVGGGNITEVPHAIYLLPLWLVVLGAAVVLTAIYVAGVLSGRSAFPRWMALVNPVTLTAAIIAASLPFPRAAAFLIPASANLVHIIFFAFTTACAGRIAAHADRRAA
jgi:hypothetical protein